MHRTGHQRKTRVCNYGDESSVMLSCDATDMLKPCMLAEAIRPMDTVELGGTRVTHWLAIATRLRSQLHACFRS